MKQKCVHFAANETAFGSGTNAHPVQKHRDTIPLGENQPEGEPSMRCLSCNAELKAGEQFCPVCGSGVASSESYVSDVPSVIEMAKWPHLTDEHGHAYPIRPGVNTLGREDTDIIISDKSVSRRHSVIVFDEERDLFSVEDAGSTNGSRINGDVLPSHKPRPLLPGDTISVGNIVLRFATHGYGPDTTYPPNVESSDDPTLPTAVTTTQPGTLGRLELVRGEGPAEIFLAKGITTFGRSPDNNVCLADDRHVSGHHARIDAEGDLFLLIDIGSTNGTYLNGLRLTTNVAVAISDDDEIRVGSALMMFKKIPLSQSHIESGVEPTVLSMAPAQGDPN